MSLAPFTRKGNPKSKDKTFLLLLNLHAQRRADEQDVMDYVAARVAPFKKVRLVEFIDQIPNSPTGKILRHKLRERERERERQRIGATAASR